MNDFVNIELPFGGTFDYTSPNLQNKNDIIQVTPNRFVAFSSQFNQDYGFLSIIDFDDYANSNTYQVTYSEFFIRTFTPNFTAIGVKLEKISSDKVLLVFGRDLYVIQLNPTNYTILLTETDFFVAGGLALANTTIYTWGQRYNSYAFKLVSLFENEFFFIDNESTTINFGSSTNQIFKFYHCVYNPGTNSITKTLKNTFSSSSGNIGTSNNIQGEFKTNIHIIPGTTDVYMNFSTSLNASSTAVNGIGGAHPLVRFSVRMNSSGDIQETYDIPGNLTNDTFNTLLTANAVNSIALRPNLIIYHRNAGTAVEVLYNGDFTSALNIGTGADTNAVINDLVPLDGGNYIISHNSGQGAGASTISRLQVNVLKIEATDLIRASQGVFSINESVDSFDRANSFKGNFIVGANEIYSIRLGNERVDAGRINFPLRRIVV